MASSYLFIFFLISVSYQLHMVSHLYQCGRQSRCPSGMACGQPYVISQRGVDTDELLIQNLGCVTALCTGSSQCPPNFYCNDEQVFGEDGHGGICIENTKWSFGGPRVYTGDNQRCYGSSNCPKGKYCNDQELYGQDGHQGFCV